jgi:hypothetical protein
MWFLIKVNANATDAIIEYEEHESRVMYGGQEELHRACAPSFVTNALNQTDGYSAIDNEQAKPT